MPGLSMGDLTGMDFAVVEENLGQMGQVSSEMNGVATDVQTDAQSTQDIWSGSGVDQFENKMRQMHDAFGTFEEDWRKIAKFIGDVKDKYLEVDQRSKRRFQ